jgi:GNAT superfamily N-acetyltransferase
MDFKMEIKKDTRSVKLSAAEDGKVVGWAYLYIISNDRHDEPYGFLENVYIEKEFRGQGVGTRLIEQVISKARELGCYKLVATSRDSNEQAHKFYKKFGLKSHGLEFRLDLLESRPKQED